MGASQHHDRMSVLDQLHVLGLVGLAMLLGAIIGVERGRANKPAGIRTNMLVAGASALVVALGDAVLDNSSSTMGDPTRALHAVITGIGFIGGGAILREGRGRSNGLTSAASIFFVAALGAACGLGYFVVGAGTTLLALLTLRGVKSLEQRITESITARSPRRLWRRANKSIDDHEYHEVAETNASPPSEPDGGSGPTSNRSA